MEAGEDTVVTATCADSKGQHWRTTDRGEVVNREGRCLTAAGTGGGQKVLAQVCTGSAAQRWKFREGRVWLGSLCLTIRGPYDTPGAVMQTWNTEEDPKPADEMYWKLSG
jgi:hypothetical protein